MKYLAALAMTLMLSLQLHASTFEIDWDIREGTRQASRQAQDILRAKSGGVDGLTRASMTCHNAIPTFEVNADSMYCIAFDLASAMWVMDDLGKDSVPDGSYWGAQGVLFRMAPYFQDFTQAGMSDILAPVSAVLNEEYAARGNKHEKPVTQQPTAAPTQPIVAKPSFDCAKASSTNEKLICSDAELAALDNELDAVYKQAKAKAADPAAFKQITVDAWRMREARCREKACLVQWYTERKTALTQQ